MFATVAERAIPPACDPATSGQEPSIRDSRSCSPEDNLRRRQGLGGNEKEGGRPQGWSPARVRPGTCRLAHCPMPQAVRKRPSASALARAASSTPADATSPTRTGRRGAVTCGRPGGGRETWKSVPGNCSFYSWRSLCLWPRVFGCSAGKQNRHVAPNRIPIVTCDFDSARFRTSPVISRPRAGLSRDRRPARHETSGRTDRRLRR